MSEIPFTKNEKQAIIEAQRIRLAAEAAATMAVINYAKVQMPYPYAPAIAGTKSEAGNR